MFGMPNGRYPVIVTATTELWYWLDHVEAVPEMKRGNA